MNSCAHTSSLYRCESSANVAMLYNAFFLLLAVTRLSIMEIHCGSLGQDVGTSKTMRMNLCMPVALSH